MLCNIEINIAIITASMPAVKVCVMQLIPERWHSTPHQSNSSGAYIDNPDAIVFSKRNKMMIKYANTSLQDVGGILQSKSIEEEGEAV